MSNLEYQSEENNYVAPRVSFTFGDASANTTNSTLDTVPIVESIETISVRAAGYALVQVKGSKMPLDQYLSSFLEKYVSPGLNAALATDHADKHGLIVVKNSEDFFDYAKLDKLLSDRYERDVQRMQVGYHLPFTLDQVKNHLHNLIEEAGESLAAAEYLNIVPGAKADSKTVKAKTILRKTLSSLPKLLKRHYRMGLATVGVLSAGTLWLSGGPHNKNEVEALYTLGEWTNKVGINLNNSPIIGPAIYRADDMYLDHLAKQLDTMYNNNGELILSKLARGEYAQHPDDPSRIIVTFDSQSPPSSDNNLFNGTIDELSQTLDAKTRLYTDAANKSLEQGYIKEYGDERIGAQKMIDAKRQLIDWLQHPVKPKLNYKIKPQNRSPYFDKSIFSPDP